MPPALPAFLQFVRREWPLAVALLFALSLSLYQLTVTPPTWYDEGMIVQLSMNLARHGELGTQIAPGEFVSAAYTSTGFPVLMPVAASFALFGVSLASARAVMVLFILLLVLVSYFFVKRFAGQSAALWSAALLVTFSSLYGSGKNVLGEVPGLSFLFLFLIFAHALFESGAVTRKNMLLAGFFFGLCVVTKPTFLVLGAAALFAFTYASLARGRLALPLSLIPWGIGAALVPILMWALTQFSAQDDFSRILAFYANPYQLADVASVMGNNLLRFVTETTPLYLLGMLLVWCSAVGIKMYKRIRLSFTEIVSLSFVFLIIIAYLRTPGWYRYLFPAQIVATVFFPAAFLYLTENFPIARLRALVSRCAPVALACLLALQLYVLFFSSWIAGYSGSSQNAALKEYFGAWDPATSVLIYDNPHVPLFLPAGTPYYQYIEVNADGYWAIGEENLSGIQSRIPDAVVVSSETASDARLFAGYVEKDTVSDLSVLVRDREE